MCRVRMAAAVPSPPQLPPHLEAGRRAEAAAPVVNSKLHNIVLQYLRHQHRQACMQAPMPISTLPPMSLITSNPLPQVGLQSSQHCTQCMKHQSCPSLPATPSVIACYQLGLSTVTTRSVEPLLIVPGRRARCFAAEHHDALVALSEDYVCLVPCIVKAYVPCLHLL